MDFTKLQNLLDKFVEEYKTPGVDCMVYQNHKPLFRYYAGKRDIENNLPTDGNEIYMIYSMSKLVTCTAALQLLEQSKYILNDPVSKYLPEFSKMKIDHTILASQHTITTTGIVGESTSSANVVSYAENPITVKHLFTMTAGLDYGIADEAITTALSQGKTSTLDLVKAMGNKVLHFEPGTHFEYSLCHDVLGGLIEVWSGQKFGDYVKEHIFEPLGMKDTFFTMPKEESLRSRLAARYAFDENHIPTRLPMENPFVFTEEYESGGAGLFSTTEDYAIFLDALACDGVGKSGARILANTTIDLMKTNQLGETHLEAIEFKTLRPGYGYGLGVRTHIDRAKSGSLSPLGEFGWDGAGGAFAMVDTKNNLSLTYFQQIFGWDGRIQTELRNALYACLEEIQL